MVGAVNSRRNHSPLSILSGLSKGLSITRLLLISIIVTLFGGLPALADIGGRGEGDHQFLQLKSTPTDSEQRSVGRRFLPAIDYSFRWSVQNDGAQALSQGQLIWEFPKNAYLPLPPTPGGRARLSELHPDSWSLLALYDVKIQLILRDSNNPNMRYGLVLDLGIPNKPTEKKWSINLASRTSWDQLLTRYDGPGLNNGIHLSSAEARAVVGEAGVEQEYVVESSWLVSAKMSTVAYFDYLLSKRIDWQAELMVRTVQAQLDSIDRITGLPTEKIRQRLAVARVEINRNITEIPRGVLHLFNKMNKGLPSRYISPVRRAFYQEERARIQAFAERAAEDLKPGRKLDDYPAWFDNKVQTLGLK